MTGSFATTFPATTIHVVLAYIFVGLIPFITGSILIVAQYYYYSYRKLSFIKKRHPFLVIICSSFFIGILMIEQPLKILSQIHSLPYSLFLLQFLSWIVFLIFSKAGLIAFAFRVYLFYYDVNWTKASNSLKWHSIIDESLNQKSVNWFIANHSTWGNIYFVRKYAISIWLIFIIIPTLVVVINPHYLFYASAVDNITSICLPIYIILVWYKTPVFYDEFLICKEIKGNIIILLLMNIWHGQYIITGLMGNESFVSWIITSFGTICIIIAFVSLPLIWTLASYKHMQSVTTNGRAVKFNMNDNELNSNISPRNIILNIDIIDILKTDDGFNAFMNHLAKEFSMENLLSIIEMTQYKQRFRQIIKFQKETDVRSHFYKKSSIFEKVVQIRNAFVFSNANIIDRDKDSDRINYRSGSISSKLENDEVLPELIRVRTTSQSGEEKTDVKQENVTLTNLDSILSRSSLIDIRKEIIHLPMDLPKSTIVYGKDLENKDENKEYLISLDIKIEAQRMIPLLINKYVHVNSDLELNLSYRVRQRLMRKYEQLLDLDEIALEHVFDQCMEHVLKLMQDSYVRFKETPAFSCYEQKLSKKGVDLSSTSTFSIQVI